VKRTVGYKVSKNRIGIVYFGLWLVLGYSKHRYMFDMVELNKKLDASKLSEIATKEELLKVIKALKGK
jgi:hypothetical protein